MSPKTIKKIDYYFGKPICFFLTLFRIYRPESAAPKRIVFLKFIEQGATVLAYSAIKRATELVGRENVFFCVFEDNRPILDILDIIPQENVITISDKTFFSFLTTSFSALRKMRKEKIDTSIDMEFFSRASAIFSFLTGATKRVGLHRFTAELPYRGNLMTHRIHYNPYLHISGYYYSLVEALSRNPSEIPMMKIPIASLQKEMTHFTPSEKEKVDMQHLLASAFDKDNTGQPIKIVILNPNAGDLLPLRKWESEKFIELGKKIIAGNNQARLVITGTAAEARAAEDICSKIDSIKAVSFAGKTTLRELLTLYSLSDILVTNDSGPGHFSALTNIRTFILFGPETPLLFGPISPNAIVIRKELVCSPCVNIFNHRFSPCNNNVCMQSISSEEVYSAVKHYLN